MADPPPVVPEPPSRMPATAEEDEAPIGTVRPLAPPRPDGVPPPADDHEVPSGTVRPNAPRRPRDPGEGNGAGVARPRRRRPSGRIALLLGLVVVLLLAVLFFANSIFTPFRGEGSGVVRVQIPKGATARQVGDLLAQRDVVNSGFFFSLRAAIAGERENLRSGTFTLHHDMSNGAALDVLTTEPPAPPVIRVVLPEGPSRREFAPIVRKAGVAGSYLAASKSSPRLNPRTYGAPKGTPSLEGFLFPATYELRPGASADRLVAQQIEAFRTNFAQLDLAYARKKNLSRYDVLIIASMVERETAVPSERRRIASVIYNRLRDGIPLGIDASTRYFENNWTRPLKLSELQRDNAYNTRLRQGLPPTPIGNPGLASMKAAANPERTGFLFYVVKPCGNGAHAFSKTDAEFQRDVAAYNRKRAQLGGRDPSTCPK